MVVISHASELTRGVDMDVSEFIRGYSSWD